MPDNHAVNWVGTWMAAPQLTEPGNLPPAPGFIDSTLRQVIRLTLGGKRLRVRFSNEFGTAPITLTSVHIARPGGAGGTIRPETDRALTFQGNRSVTIPVGAAAVSDALAFDLSPLSDLVVTLHTSTPSRDITGHPGSRCTSYLREGSHVSAPDLTAATKVDHWYFLSGVEVEAKTGASAVVTLGDSITDGRGSPTNGNGRWPDFLARRLQANKATAQVAVLNAGIGGNCVIRGGLGPPALARLDRDVLSQPGVRWLVVFEGINDLGGGKTSGREMIAAYRQIIIRAKSHGLKVYGATILPCGQSFYFKPELEAARQEINQWIRTGKAFDAVIDLDAAMRDPNTPSQLSAAAESPDHLHPSGNGYKVLADAIDLRLFTG
jgi:lysophospholipase L1-like esterase